MCEDNARYGLKHSVDPVEMIDFIIATVTQVHPDLVSLCVQVGSQYQLKLKSSRLMSPTCIMWDLSNLLKCLLIEYLWQLLGISHTSSQTIPVIMVVNLAPASCQQCPEQFTSINSPKSSSPSIACCVPDTVLEGAWCAN